MQVDLRTAADFPTHRIHPVLMCIYVRRRNVWIALLMPLRHEAGTQNGGVLSSEGRNRPGDVWTHGNRPRCQSFRPV